MSQWSRVLRRASTPARTIIRAANAVIGRVSPAPVAGRAPVGVPTDNYYFKVALELGWVGLGIWLWLISRLLHQAWRACRLAVGRPGPTALALGTLATLAALTVGALSNDIIVQKPIAELFWVLAGLTVWLTRHLEDPGRRTGATAAPRRAPAP